jgi:hypothetical protein
VNFLVHNVPWLQRRYVKKVTMRIITKSSF